MLWPRIGRLGSAALILLASSALAQSVNYTSVEATAGTPAQLTYHATAHKNCMPAPLPSVRVIKSPAAGMLIVRKAILTTDRLAGCPAVKTPAQVVLYQARAGYEGLDEVKYEVTSANGEVADYDVTIAVKQGPAETKPPAPPAGERL